MLVLNSTWAAGGTWDVGEISLADMLVVGLTK
jgi:hypothetical protein